MQHDTNDCFQARILIRAQVGSCLAIWIGGESLQVKLMAGVLSQEGKITEATEHMVRQSFQFIASSICRGWGSKTNLRPACLADTS